jgi:hypothetical protein
MTRRIWELRVTILLAALALFSPLTQSDDGPAYRPQLQGSDYPWLVARFSFVSQGETLEMAWM